MNETLIFFKIGDVIKNYRNWSYIYKNTKKQWMKRKFYSKYEMSSKKCRNWSCIYQDRNER